MDSVRRLMEYQLCLLYDAEKKSARALGRLATKCRNPELIQALRDHQETTLVQIDRLTRVFEIIDHKPERKPCAGINGLVEEFSDFLGSNPDPPILDLFAVESARRVERYEICAYQALITLCVALGAGDVTEILAASLAEESAAGDRFKALAIAMTEAQLPSRDPEPD